MISSDEYFGGKKFLALTPVKSLSQPNDLTTSLAISMACLSSSAKYSTNPVIFE